MIEIKKAQRVFNIDFLTNNGSNYVRCPCGWDTGTFDDMAQHLIIDHRLIDDDADLSLRIEVMWWERLYNNKGALSAKEAAASAANAREKLRDQGYR